MRYNKERAEYLLKQEKTEEVIEELIVLNFGLMQKQLNKFYLRDDPDALSFAYESLYNAILTYDASKNSKFSTYATVCIYNRLGSYIRTLKTQQNLSVTSYENPVDESGRTLLDKLESKDTADGELISSCGVFTIELAVIECIVALNNPLHKQIVRTWSLSNYQKTHTVIADELGCTQSYVSQVIKTFKNNLKKKLGEY